MYATSSVLSSPSRVPIKNILNIPSIMMANQMMSEMFLGRIALWDKIWINGDTISTAIQWNYGIYANIRGQHIRQCPSSIAFPKEAETRHSWKFAFRRYEIGSRVRHLRIVSLKDIRKDVVAVTGDWWWRSVFWWMKYELLIRVEYFHNPHDNWSHK